MKVADKKREHITNFKGKSNSFKIETNAKALSALVEGLYSDKVYALVRELSSNAYDAHAEAGIPDKPFDVFVPSLFDTHFYIRDYGNSMDHDTVMELYSTIFYSSKDQTNTQIGYFGLGSKSPFAYTDSFTVVTYINGMKNDYMCFINNTGVPTVQHVGQKETGEPNGTKISLAIASKDVEAFHVALNKTFLLNTPPNFINFELNSIKPSGKALNLYVFDSDTFPLPNNTSGMFLKQGAVTYPLDLSQYGVDTELTKLFSVYTHNAYGGPTKVSMRHGLGAGKRIVIDVPIGTFEVTPSREDISYSEETIESLNSWFKQYHDQITDHIDDTLKNCTNRKEYNSKLSLFHHLLKDEFWKDIKLSNGFKFQRDWLQSIVLISDKEIEAIAAGTHKVLHKGQYPSKSPGSDIFRVNPIGQGEDIVPGYLYTVSNDGYSPVLNVINALGVTLYSGLERNVPRKYSRMKQNPKTGYYCFSQDLPRFVRLLDLDASQVKSLEDLPNVNQRAGSSRASVKNFEGLEDNQYVVLAKRNKVIDPYFEELGTDHFHAAFNHFKKVHPQIFKAHEKKLADAEIVFFTPLQCEKLQLDDKLFGKRLKSCIDVNTLIDLVKDYESIQLKRRSSHTFKHNIMSGLNIKYNSVHNNHFGALYDLLWEAWSVGGKNYDIKDASSSLSPMLYNSYGGLSDAGVGFFSIMSHFIKQQNLKAPKQSHSYHNIDYSLIPEFAEFKKIFKQAVKKYPTPESMYNQFKLVDLW